MFPKIKNKKKKKLIVYIICISSPFSLFSSVPTPSPSTSFLMDSGRDGVNILYIKYVCIYIFINIMYIVYYNVCNKKSYNDAQ